MKPYVHGNPLIPEEWRDADTGLRPSVRKLLQLVDTADPAWPHTAAVLREMADAGVEIGELEFGIAVKIGAHRLAELDATKRTCRKAVYQMAPLASMGPIVYYVQRGNVIKIGTTTVPVMRFTSLMPDKILAFEPGGAREELARHRQFAHLRCSGEHFRPAPELMMHTRELRRIYGDPDPSWPTVADLEKTKKPAVKEVPAFVLPAAVSGIKLTVAEAGSYLGINRGTLSGWIFRRMISPAGHDGHGRQVFCLEHLIALHDRPASVRARAAQARIRAAR